jgi:hypothetical protein
VKSKISFRAIGFVDSADIFHLQETSGGPGVVLVRYVLLLPASFGLEFPVLVLGSSSSIDWDRSWRRLVSDPGLCDRCCRCVHHRMVRFVHGHATFGYLQR